MNTKHSLLIILSAAVLVAGVGCKDQQTPPSNTTPSNMPHGFTDEPIRSYRLGINEMLKIQNSTSTTLLDFESFGSEEGGSTYRWRFIPNASDEKYGSGSVYEKYEQSWESKTNCVLTDVGSLLKFKAGPHEIEWSYGSENEFGWVYLDTTDLNIEIVADDEFSSYK